MVLSVRHHARIGLQAVSFTTRKNASEDLIRGLAILLSAPGPVTAQLALECLPITRPEFNRAMRAAKKAGRAVSEPAPGQPDWPKYTAHVYRLV